MSVKAEIWYQNEFKYAEFNVCFQFLSFWPNIPFYAKNISGSWKYFQLFWIYRAQCWCSLFFVFERIYIFFGPKIQNYQCKPKFHTCITSNMQNSMVAITFCLFEKKYSFWANFVQIIKMDRLSWKLMPRLLRIWRIE